MKKFLLSLLAVMFAVTGFAAETVYYTLDGTQTGGSSGYATESDITQDGIAWKVTGNTTMNPWRIGGKSLSGVDRPAYSTTGMGKAISKVDLTIGTMNLTSLNSIKLVVASDAAFNSVLDEITKTGVSASSTLTFEPTSGTEWATGAYYKFIFNVTETGTSSNKFVQFIKAEFYADDSGASVTAPTISPNGGSDLTEAQTVTLSGDEGDTIYYTLDGSTPSNESTEYTAPFTVSETTTVKAIAYNAAGDASTVTSAIFSFRVAATSIADFYTKAEGGNTVYINFPMTVTAANAEEGKTFYVTDGTSYSAIYCSTATLSYGIGNVIPAGWNATLSDFHKLKEIVPSDAASMPQASSTVEVNYPVLRGTDIVAENQSMPGTLKNFELPEDMPARATNINVTYDDASFVLRNSFLIDAVSAGTYDVTGVIIVYDTTVQFLPLEFVKVIPEPAPDVYILGNVNGNSWSPSQGVQMEYDEELGVYVAEVYATSGAMINFAHNLAESWEALNVEDNRFGPDDTANYNVNDTDLEIPAEYSTDPHSFVLAAGKWEVVVNLDNNGSKTVDFTKLTFAAPTFSEESKEFHAAFDLTITGPEGSTITYVLNDDIDNAVTTQSNVAVVNIPAEDTSVLAWATMYGVDSESAEENYLYSASTGTTYTKLAPGAVVKAGKYLIVYEGSSSSGDASSSILAFDGSRTNASDNKLDDTNNYVELSAENGTITTGDEIYFTISRDNDGFLIKSASGYYIGQASNANGLTASESPIYNAGLSVGEDGAEIISAGGAYLRFNSASNQNRFRYFKSATYSNQKAIQLYYSDTTGVDSVAADSEVVSTAYYNLQGVRLAAPAQGQVAIRVSTLANGQIRASKVVVR